MSTDETQPLTPDDRLREAYLAESADGVRAALAAGANPDLKVADCPVVAGAAFIANLEMLEALIAAGANVNARGVLGLTPPMYIASGKNSPTHMQALRRLISAGADLSLTSPDGLTALDLSRVFLNPTAEELLQGYHAPAGRSGPRRDNGWTRN
jgi:hypothetical protein